MVLLDEVEVDGGVVVTPLPEEGSTTSTQLQDDVMYLRNSLHYTNILLSCLIMYLFITGIFGKGWRK